MGKSAKDGDGVERTRTTAEAQAAGLRVWVAGIAWKLTEETLWRDFEDCGVIEDLFLMKDHDGNSRGQAFITFRDKEGVEGALKFNDTEYGGRTIFVKVGEAKKKKEEPAEPEWAPTPKPAVGKIIPTTKPAGCRAVCIKNVGDASESDVRKLLEGCKIQSVRIVTDRYTGEPRGIVFVDFCKGFDVDQAMEFNGSELNGKEIEMTYEAPRERPRPEGCMTVAIKKLPATTLEVDVRKLLAGLKSLSEVRIIMKDRVCNGLAFAEFDKEQDVEDAVQRDGMKVKGEVVFICYETKASRRQKLKETAVAKAVERESQGLVPKATPNWCPEGDGARRKKKNDKVPQDEEEPEEVGTAKKKKRRKGAAKEDAEEEDDAGQEAEAQGSEDAGKVKKKKKTKSAEEEDEEEVEKGEDADKAKKKRRKKGGAKEDAEEDVDADPEVEAPEGEHAEKATKKKRKKGASKEDAEEDADEVEEGMAEEGVEASKERRRKKSKDKPQDEGLGGTAEEGSTPKKKKKQR